MWIGMLQAGLKFLLVLPVHQPFLLRHYQHHLQFPSATPPCTAFYPPFNLAPLCNLCLLAT